jgi:hypothetical protein
MQVHKKMQKLIPWRATFLKRRIQIIKYRFEILYLKKKNIWDKLLLTY